MLSVIYLYFTVSLKNLSTTIIFHAELYVKRYQNFNYKFGLKWNGWGKFRLLATPPNKIITGRTNVQRMKR
jgi:hypothetical protein